MPDDTEDLHLPEVQLAAALMANSSALVTGPDGTGAALLRAAAARLALSRTRVLRVGPPLDLPGFLDQAAKAGGLAGGTGVEQGFAALTDGDPSCDRIALLVEDAHLMPDATLRYIEFAMHAGPHLCVAFAGQPGIAATLGLAGYAGLRKRLSLHLVLSPAQPAAPVANPRVVPAPLPAMAVPVRRRAGEPWRVLAGAALAAGVAAFLWPRPVPPRSTGVAVNIQVGPALSALAEPSSPPGVQPAADAARDVAAVGPAEPVFPAVPWATAATSFLAEPDPALPDAVRNEAVASLPPAPAPDLPVAPAAPAGAQPASPAPEMTGEAAVPASPVLDAAPDLRHPVTADAPAATSSAVPDRDGPVPAAVAGLLPEQPAPVPLPTPVVQAAPQAADPLKAPGQDGSMPAAIAELPSAPPAPALVPPLPAPAMQAATQMAGPLETPGYDSPVPAANWLPPAPPALAPMPASVMQATPLPAGPPAVPGHDGPVPAAVTVLPPAPTPPQPAADFQGAPQAAGRRTAPASHDPPAIQTAARPPAARRLPLRAYNDHAEQAAARPAAPGPYLGYCRSLVLRAQLGEDLTYGDRIFMRNGCR